MSDKETTIQELKDKLKKFRDERDWEQFHDPKNLAAALAIESGELMEHFLWMEKSEIAKKLKGDPAYREDISDELADVVGYALHFACAAGIDIADAIEKKYHKNAKKYPVEKSKGKATKYTKL